MRKSQLWFLVLVSFLSLAFAARAALPQATNLLTNGSATSPLSTGWTIIGNGGQGWVTSTSGGKDGVGGQFLTSYIMCNRSQTIDLLAKGATAEELDAAPPIRVEEYFQSVWLNNNAQDAYYIKVELRSATGAVIASWNQGTVDTPKLIPAINVWYQEANEFRNYGPGVRYIYIEDGGRDNGFWADQYGVNMDAASVTFLNIPPTDITASRSVYASNAPAGGLVGFLSATDVDDTLHTFALVPEVTIGTTNLISASAPGWRYFDGTTPVAVDWAEVAADDSAWGSGPAPLGYDSTAVPTDTWQVTKVGYGPNASTKPIAAYVRKTFTFNGDPQSVTALGGTLMVDDGCVIYLNGHEVYRDNMPSGAVTSTTPAINGIGGTDENDYKAWSVPPDKLIYLLPGQNVLAVEVHQNAITSSDMSIDVTLDVSAPTSTNNYNNNLFTIVDNQLRLAQPASAMGAGAKTIRVQATDSGGNSIFRTLTVNPLGVAFTSTPTALTLTPQSFAEHQPLATPLSQFSATDADANDILGYELVAGTGSTDNALFTIRGNQLFAVAVTDYETKKNLSIRVKVTDSVGLTTTAVIPITLIDDVTEDDDHDGLPESAEDLNNNGVVDPGETSPYLADTDGDGFGDKLERDNGSDPTNPNSVPSVVPLRQIVTHATGESWLTATSWENGIGLGPTNMAVVDNLTFRPPPTQDPVLPALGVDLRNGAIFRLKHLGLVSVPKIKLDNATIQQGMTVSIAVGGPGSTIETNTLGIFDAAAVPLDVQASLSGQGIFRAIGTTGGQVLLSVAAQNFTGDFVVAGAEVQLNNATALGSAGRVLVNSGKLKVVAATSLPNAILVDQGTGVLSLSGNLTVATAVLSGVVLPAGTYSVSDLNGQGVSPVALEDLGGTLTVSGTLNTVDSDGDGATDVEEALAQTNPHDRTSRLRIASMTSEIGGSGPAIRLSFSTIPGVNYRVDFTENILSTWIPGPTITATAAITEYVDASNPSFFPQGFYRLVVVP